MIRAVIDTNVILSAVIKPDGRVGAILELLRNDAYCLLYSDQLITEFVDVINRPRIRLKYNLRAEDIETVLALLFLRGEAVVPSRRIDVCRDPKDNMLLELAVAGQAAVVVSGDKDILELGEFEGISLESPADFLGRFSL